MISRTKEQHLLRDFESHVCSVAGTAQHGVWCHAEIVERKMQWQWNKRLIFSRRGPYVLIGLVASVKLCNFNPLTLLTHSWTLNMYSPWLKSSPRLTSERAMNLTLRSKDRPSRSLCPQVGLSKARNSQSPTEVTSCPLERWTYLLVLGKIAYSIVSRMDRVITICVSRAGAFRVSAFCHDMNHTWCCYFFGVFKLIQIMCLYYPCTTISRHWSSHF